MENMMSATESPTLDRISNAEETLGKAQAALETAQEGLEAADQAVTKANELTSSRWVKVSLGAVLAVVFLAVAASMRNRRN